MEYEDDSIQSQSNYYTPPKTRANTKKEKLVQDPIIIEDTWS